MKRFPLILAFLCITLTSVSVLANPTPQWSDGGVALDAILDDFSINPANTSVDVLNDYLNNDSYWSINASGGSIHSVVVGFSGSTGEKTLGIFSPNSNNSGLEMVELFNETSSPGDQAVLSIKSNGSVYLNFADTGIDFTSGYFGYYLVSGGNTWYSDSSLNGDNQDHMVAYQGNGVDIIQVPGFVPGIWTTNSYLFGFEESSVPGDYADFVFTAESISPESVIPAPGALLLVMVGVGSLKIRRIA